MNRTTTTGGDRRPVVPSERARRMFGHDLIPVHNSALCDCADCRALKAQLDAWQVKSARRQREERRARRAAHRDAVFEKARSDPAFATFMRELRALMIGRPEPFGWDFFEVCRRDVVSWTRPGMGRCRIPLRPGGGTTLTWGPCGKARHPDCIERVAEWEIAELTAELDGRKAIVKRFRSRPEAEAYRRGTASREKVRVKGERKVPGVRMFDVGRGGECVLVFPAELRPDEPGARTGEHLGRALLKAWLQRVEKLPEPRDEDAADRPRRPTLRQGVEPETVKMLAEERGMLFDFEQRGAWTVMYFYGCDADDVDDLITAANEAGADVLGNLALARAGP